MEFGVRRCGLGSAGGMGWSGAPSESPFAIEAAFEEDAAQMGVPSYEVSRRGVCDDGGSLDLPAGGRVVEVLHHVVGEPADLAEELVVMAEEYSEHLGKSEDDLAVRQAERKPLVHVLAEQQGSLLRARGSRKRSTTFVIRSRRLLPRRAANSAS